MEKMMKKIILTLIGLFLIALIVVPLLTVFLLSIATNWSSSFPTSFGLEWWQTIFKPKYTQVLLNTFMITVASTLLTTGYAIVASYLFAFYNFKLKELFSVLLLAPTYVAGVVLALGLLTMYPQIRNTFWILMLGHFIIISPITFKYVLSSMKKISTNLIEASSSLGSSKWNTFSKIILPLSKHGILAGIILSIGMSISELSVSLLLYGAGMATLPIRIYLEWYSGSLGVAGVLSTILICITIIVVLSLEYFKEKSL